MRKLKDKVLSLDDKGLSAREIADRLGVRIEYVRATRSRAGRVPCIEEYTKAQIKRRMQTLRELLSEAEKRLAKLERHASRKRAATAEEPCSESTTP